MDGSPTKWTTRYDETGTVFDKFDKNMSCTVKFDSEHTTCAESPAIKVCEVGYDGVVQAWMGAAVCEEHYRSLGYSVVDTLRDEVNLMIHHGGFLRSDL